MSKLEIELNKQDRLTSSVLSKGNQIKWRKNGLWIKADSIGTEGIAEYVASNILKCSDIRVGFVEYALCKAYEDQSVSFNHRLHEACCSKDFLHPGDNLLTFARLFNDNLTDWSELTGNQLTEQKIQFCLEEVFRITALDVTDYLAATLQLDALIYNADRHYGNFAVIFNEVTGFRTVPIFDNGLSCLSYVRDDNKSKNIRPLLEKVKAKPFCSCFKKQMECLGTRFTVDKQLFIAFLEAHRGVIGRAYDVMHHSMATYPEIYK